MSLLQWSSLFALVSVVAAQGAAWSQCGGQGWTGATTCVSGYTCVYSNQYYSQCVPSSSSGGSGGSGTSTTTTASLPGSTSTAYSNTVAKAAGKKYFGSATDNPELTNSAYVKILSNTEYFGQITPGNSMKWDATEPEQGVFDFTGGNQIVTLAEGNGQMLRGHNCVWSSQLPSWVTAGNFDASQLSAIVVNHCSTIVGHWAGKIYSWDVVNEPLNWDGTFSADVFYNTLGVSYISLALNAARAADPKAKLYINDYGIESLGAKSTGMLNLAKQLLANGDALDGIGFESHFSVGQVPTTIAASMKQFTAIGLEVAVTELDIAMTLPETAALLEQQKTDYETVISACRSVSGCVGVTIWDYTDLYSWIPSASPGHGAACPWDSNLVKKPAYDGIIAGWTS